MVSCSYHRCHKKCGVKKLYCKAHWEALPFNLKEQISEAYVVGDGMSYSDAFFETWTEASAWLDQNTHQ